MDKSKIIDLEEKNGEYVPVSKDSSVATSPKSRNPEEDFLEGFDRVVNFFESVGRIAERINDARRGKSRRPGT